MNQEFTEAMTRFIQNIRLRYPNSTTAVHYQSDLEQFGQSIAKAPRAATVNRRLASLSSFFEFLAEEAGDDHWPNPVQWGLHRIAQGSHLPRDLPEALLFDLANFYRPLRKRAVGTT